MNEINVVYKEDCLTGMNRIKDKSIDLILCDLPYGTTDNAWDNVIPFEPLWAQYERIIKDNGAIVLTAQPPFSYLLAGSNLKLYRYEWIWVKDIATGFLNAKKMPLKNTEYALVFYKSLPVYNPQMRTGFKPYFKKRKGNTSSNYRTTKESQSQSNGDRFPLQTISIAQDKDRFDINSKGQRHPTQKPQALFEYFIKTYTNPGALVLDNCMGSGTTAAACIAAGRNYIGFETNPVYFEMTQKRIAKAEQQKEYNLFNNAA